MKRLQLTGHGAFDILTEIPYVIFQGDRVVPVNICFL